MVKKLPNSVSTSTTVRIPNHIYDIIEFEASSNDSTVSTVINNILRKHASWDRFVGDIGFMYVQKPLVRALFEKVSNKDLAQMSDTIGYARIRDAVLFIDGKVDVTGITYVIKLWLTTSNIPIRVIETDESIEFIVKHNLGNKWSIYFSTILKKLFGELKIASIEEDIEDHTVEITFSLKSKKKKK
ncbi:hypothetical protein [Nitrosopumilus adriaticus]|uniref:Uncharacterized protein n=1 Tax=Nitrosopumilus adriaticus TaxID=1580092 RepID=A0A0D5C553_9ARCH|nr:hypothetical protein [Nitrosopumilus adriaticus]AJW71527.1 hypothetical protein NADRNF5_1849 [Nitrosopumilus adriaticus]